MTAEQRERQRAASSSYAAMCADLAASGVPPSLQHDDLHDANVFVAGSEDAPYRVFDWGDAAVAHPFTTLLVTLRVVALRASLAPGAPELLRLRDAYLEPWTAEHDARDLREAARLAVRTGVVSRAACYRRALLEATPAGVEEYGDGVPGWLQELFEPLPCEPASPLA
jgi:aminoglycoside phosphotransferase (APT) family kinase protein